MKKSTTYREHTKVSEGVTIAGAIGDAVARVCGALAHGERVTDVSVTFLAAEHRAGLRDAAAIADETVTLLREREGIPDERLMRTP